MRNHFAHVLISFFLGLSLLSQTAFLYLHDHNPEIQVCHQEKGQTNSQTELHQDDCVISCNLCGLFYSNVKFIDPVENLRLFASLDHINSYYLTPHYISFTFHQGIRGPPGNLG